MQLFDVNYKSLLMSLFFFPQSIIVIVVFQAANLILVIFTTSKLNLLGSYFNLQSSRYNHETHVFKMGCLISSKHATNNTADIATQFL